MLEGPGEEWVKLSLHESDEEGDMSASTRPIPIEIDTQAQLVAMSRGEEWGTVEGDGLPQDGIPPPPGQLRQPPDVHSIVAGNLQGLYVCHNMLEDRSRLHVSALHCTASMPSNNECALCISYIQNA